MKQIIKATNENIENIVAQEIKKYGPEADLNHIDVSGVTDMSFLFFNLYIFEDLKFNGDVSNVKNMKGMFGFSEFTGDISGWDVSKVQDMSGMFRWSAFNGDISHWDVSNVRDMSEMFKGVKFNRDLSKWDVSSVENIKDMFLGCSIRDEYKPKF